jgi:hypothetical protein
MDRSLVLTVMVYTAGLVWRVGFGRGHGRGPLMMGLANSWEELACCVTTVRGHSNKVAIWKSQENITQT